MTRPGDGRRFSVLVVSHSYPPVLGGSEIKAQRVYSALLLWGHLQGLHPAAGLPVARFLGKPVFMKVSGSGIITTMRGSWLGRLELRFLRRWARRVMILNPGMAEEAAAARRDVPNATLAERR